MFSDLLKAHGPISENVVFIQIVNVPSPKKSWFQISITSVNPFG